MPVITPAPQITRSDPGTRTNVTLLGYWSALGLAVLGSLYALLCGFSLLLPDSTLKYLSAVPVVLAMPLVVIQFLSLHRYFGQEGQQGHAGFISASLYRYFGLEEQRQRQIGLLFACFYAVLSGLTYLTQLVLVWPLAYRPGTEWVKALNLENTSAAAHNLETAAYLCLGVAVLLYLSFFRPRNYFEGSVRRYFSAIVIDCALVAAGQYTELLVLHYLALLVLAPLLIFAGVRLAIMFRLAGKGEIDKSGNRHPVLTGFGIILAALVVFFLAYLVAIRPLTLNWGATETEQNMPLAGDNFVPNPVSVTTRAITINATPDKVWPWLVQFGQGKGGFYSYEFIENSIGCQIHNAEKINPEWQNRQVGESIRMMPADFMGNSEENLPSFQVIQIEPQKALILAGAMGHKVGKDAAGNISWTWSIVLEPAPDGATRLFFRTRSSTDALVDKILEPGYFLMYRGMLGGLKERAERL